MNTGEVLIVEDNESVKTSLCYLLKNAGYRIETATDGPKAVQAARTKNFTVALIDIRLPGMDGIEVLKEIKSTHPQTKCIVLTAFGTIDLSVKAMRAGAYDFITKPFECEGLLGVVREAFDRSPLGDTYWVQDPFDQKGENKFRNLIGRSPSMVNLFSLVEKVSGSDSTVLIQGESGTGKEVIARTIHSNSARREKPFIPINCGAIPESIIESELFGHEKGSFTGATCTRIGRFEMAHQGTLFLDEIGEMPASLQVKLLRVLQERQFERVGGNESIKVNVRVIAATNQDLEEAVGENRFRKDLFYRLNVIPLEVPPLRDRKDDIPLLVQYFLNQFNQEKGYRVQGVAPEVYPLLLGYSWPGNIRELENLIERVVTLKREGEITVGDLPKMVARPVGQFFLSKFKIPEEGVNFSRMVTEFEKEILQQALEKANGVKSQAAKLLHLNRTTLVEKLKRG